MAKKKNEMKVPFDKDGNLITYVYGSPPDYTTPPGSHWEDCNQNDLGARAKHNNTGWYRHVKSGEWRDNYVFHDTLAVTGITRGRSAARINLEDEHGRKYEMFLTDVADLLQRAPTIAYGMIEADWTFQKRGSNYGIRVAG